MKTHITEKKEDENGRLLSTVTAGKSLKIKVKSTPEFLALANSCGVNMALLLIHLEVPALRSWQAAALALKVSAQAQGSSADPL